MLGPADPSPALDLAGLEVVRTAVVDSPHKLFLGGLPCDWTEEQVSGGLVCLCLRVVGRAVACSEFNLICAGAGF